MQTAVLSVLSTLRDVDGVEGSFLLSDEGALVDKDLPAMFDAELFREVGPRVVRLRDTFSTVGDEMDTCAIRFSDFKLYIRSMQPGFLCVLCSVAVNVPALRMGIQLAQRRILAGLDSTGAPAPISHAPASRSPAAVYTPVPAPPPPSNSGLMYRGRPVK
jgi:predicted regulator of Ras-like GTPase activity (Roadblock/LC7/MglB family)